MDPITLATVTAATTVLARKVVEGFSSEAGKELWRRVKGVLGWTADPQPQDLPVKLAERLSTDEATARRVVELLQGEDGEASGIRQLVGRIDATKVVVVNTMHVAGDFKM